MDYSNELEIAYQLVDSDKYSDALIYIEDIRKNGCDDVILDLYEALCIYEAKDDVECLRLISKFLSRASKHRKREYALFTAGVCLMNLGLANEALSTFEQVADSYPNIESERNEAKKALGLQKNGLKQYLKIVDQQDA